MSQFQRLQDGTVLPDVETLTGNAGGAVGPDAAFNIDILGGTGLTMTGVPATSTMTMEVDAQENIIYVAKHGNDANSGLNIENAKLTIQAAVTVADAGDTILVSPGTYTETITHAANNVTMIAHGKSNTTIITQADANVIDFATFTGIEYKNFGINVTAATTAIWTVTGSTGSCVFKDCDLEMTSAADLAQVAQPGVGRLTDAGILRVYSGTVGYYHTGNGGGTAIKAAFEVADGGFIELDYIDEVEIVNGGTSLATSVCIDSASTGIFQLHDNVINIEDLGTTNVVGLGYLGGTGLTHEYFRNTMHLTGNNNCYGFYSADTLSYSRFYYNHIHITANTAYSFHVGNTSYVISEFDYLVAANGVDVVAGGHFTCVSSEIEGDLTARSQKPNDVNQISIMNTDNTATAGNAALNLSVGGTTSTGDPYVNWLITGSNTFSMGIDNSTASDNLKITDGATPSAGNTLWQMTTAGERTMPLQPAFSAFMTAAQVNATGAGASYKLCDDNNSTIYDQNADYDDDGIFTAPVTGRYFMRCQVYVTTTTAAMTDMDLRIITSNRTYYVIRINPDACERVTDGTIIVNGCAECDMDATDTCTFNVIVSSGVGDTASVGGAATNPLTGISGHLMF